MVLQHYQEDMDTFHDHNSDLSEESDDESGRKRSSSFGDAEGMLGHYYESFRIETPSPPMGRIATGLHHRTTRNHNSSVNPSPLAIRQLQYDVEGERRLRHRYKKFSTPKRCNWFRNLFAFIVFIYSLIVFRTMNRIYDNYNDHEIPDYPTTIQRQQLQQQQQQQQQRTLVYQRSVLKQNAKNQFQQRHMERQKRSRPPTQLTSRRIDLNDTQWYDMERSQNIGIKQQQQQQQTDAIPMDETPADQVCGKFAQQAALNHPSAYTAKAALNAKSVVVITGILNPVGFSLALYLHEKCGVQKVVGIDNMYPNTVLNRIQLQDRLSLLTTTFAKMKAIKLPFIGLDPKYKKGQNQNEEINLMEEKPTHIVHLASYTQDLYSNAQSDANWLNTNSPYVNNNNNNNKDHDDDDDDHKMSSSFYQLRSSMVSMEQILASIVSTAERPQFLFASSEPTTTNDKSTTLHSTSKRIDELLVDTYRGVLSTTLPSINLRMPNTIYGPWGKPGSPIHDMVQGMIEDWNAQKKSTYALDTNPNLNLLYVDDAVEAIVGAMQYRTSEPISMDVSGVETSPSSIGSLVRSLLPINGKEMEQLTEMEKRDTRKSVIYDDWSPETTIKEGMKRTIAWHLDRAAPNGSTAVETGDAFLKRNGMNTCSPDDLTCHRGGHYVPCSSECNIRDQCIPSIFDEVRDLVQTTTDGCNIVLYTQSLGYDVENLELKAEYMDEQDMDKDDLLLCNLAFVPRDSALVSKVIGKVPDNQLVKFGIKLQDSTGDTLREAKLDGLNGRLLYRGFILIWVQDDLQPLSVTDRSLLKISPGQFFHQDVTHALFVEENFPVSPNIEDCKFLVQELRRKALTKRSLKIQIGETKHKYQLPPEPQRRAAMLFPPLRYPNLDDPTVKKYIDGKKKLTVLDASKFMRYEVGDSIHGEKEPQSIRNQREFYERVPQFVNRDKELRSTYEPYYQYMMRHWVRTRWVVHDIKLEESRQLRCDWYREHIQWGTKLDQLSFAYVMAVRDVKRRIAHMEPDDKVKTFIQQYPELHTVIDSYEWHPLETDYNKIHHEPMFWKPKLQENFAIPPEEKLDQLIGDDHDTVGEDAPLFVRIISERVMADSRKRWLKYHKKK